MRVQEAEREAQEVRTAEVEDLVGRLGDWNYEIRVRAEQLLRDELVPVLRRHGRPREKAIDWIRATVREADPVAAETLERILEDATPDTEEAYKALLEMAAWHDSPWNPTPPFELFAETYEGDATYRRVFWRHQRRALQEISWEDD